MQSIEHLRRELESSLLRGSVLKARNNYKKRRLGPLTNKDKEYN
jgi:hypothetical protein